MKIVTECSEEGQHAGESGVGCVVEVDLGGASVKQREEGTEKNGFVSMWAYFLRNFYKMD